MTGLCPQDRRQVWAETKQAYDIKGAFGEAVSSVQQKDGLDNRGTRCGVRGRSGRCIQRAGNALSPNGADLVSCRPSSSLHSLPDESIAFKVLLQNRTGRGMRGERGWGTESERENTAWQQEACSVEIFTRSRSLALSLSLKFVLWCPCSINQVTIRIYPQNLHNRDGERLPRCVYIYGHLVYTYI